MINVAQYIMHLRRPVFLALAVVSAVLCDVSYAYAFDQVTYCAAGFTSNSDVFNGEYTNVGFNEWTNGAVSMGVYAGTVPILREDHSYGSVSDPYLYNNAGITDTPWGASGGAYAGYSTGYFVSGACTTPDPEVGAVASSTAGSTTADTFFLLAILAVIAFYFFFEHIYFRVFHRNKQIV